MLSVNGEFSYEGIEIVSIREHELAEADIQLFDYLMISGGDGAIRRTVETLHKNRQSIPPIIINPEGTFNLICKAYRLSTPEKIFEKILASKELKRREKSYFGVNKEHYFIFSAGNSLDMLYIVLSDLFRVGLIARSKIRYFFSIFFLLPLLLIATPIFLFVRSYFFVFNLFKTGIKKFQNVYLDENFIVIYSNSDYNIWQMDGDIVIVRSKKCTITEAGTIEFVVG